MIADLLREFHDTFGSTDPALRPTLHDEEHAELIEALAGGNRSSIAQELADVVYVAYGTALAYGIDLDAAVAEVHRANMSKSGRRADGKVLKGPDYRPPDMAVAL